MKPIGPDHPITTQALVGRVRVLFEGHEIADSGDVLVVREASYKPAYYFPRQDVEMSVLRRTDHATHCPYKGDASYFTIHRDGRIVENAVWSYEQPFEQMSLITGRVAFYPQHVTFEESAADSTPGQAATRHVPAHDPPYAEASDPRDV
jgi:uncharacterized protein (DUF427 family)